MLLRIRAIKNVFHYHFRPHFSSYSKQHSKVAETHLTRFHSLGLACPLGTIEHMLAKGGEMQTKMPGAETTEGGTGERHIHSLRRQAYMLLTVTALLYNVFTL